MATTRTGEPVAADSKIAGLIEAALGAADMSMLALSERTGIPYPTLRRSIKAGRSLTIQELGKIADALEVAPATLLPASLTQDAA
ncbi:helix-turn-helix DNA binding domain protein [Arthrobacter phage GlobiWarming]|nr:helix-turn-helix DNA binding domain protein [Arthrobacter phage GlobiWarming]